MHDVPRIDVILATYNGGAYLREQIESVLAQREVEVFIRIYDDHSADNTVSIAESYSYTQKVSVTRQPVQAGGAFQNFRRIILSMHAWSCEYFAFCDQDDIWEEDKLIKQIRAMRAADAIGCSSSVLAFSDAENADKRVVDNSGVQTRWDFFFEGGGQGCTYVFQQQLMTSLAKLLLSSDVVLPHDWSLYAYCRRAGKIWLILPEPLVRYRQHAGNAFGARGNWTGRLRRLQMLLAGDFRDRRVALCTALAKMPEAIQPVHSALLKSSFFDRIAFALPNALKLRRFKAHSLVISIFFVLGLA